MLACTPPLTPAAPALLLDLGRTDISASIYITLHAAGLAGCTLCLSTTPVALLLGSQSNLAGPYSIAQKHQDQRDTKFCFGHMQAVCHDVSMTIDLTAYVVLPRTSQAKHMPCRLLFWL